MSSVLAKGTLDLEEGVSASYEISEVREQYPVRLTLDAYVRDPTIRRPNGEADKMTLYFDRFGEIQDKSPASTKVMARGLQKLYGELLQEALTELDDAEVIIPKIKGFFQGEDGIERKMKMPNGNEFYNGFL